MKKKNKNIELDTPVIDANVNTGNRWIDAFVAIIIVCGVVAVYIFN